MRSRLLPEIINGDYNNTFGESVKEKFRSESNDSVVHETDTEKEALLVDVHDRNIDRLHGVILNGMNDKLIAEDIIHQNAMMGIRSEHSEVLISDDQSHHVTKTYSNDEDYSNYLSNDIPEPTTVDEHRPIPIRIVGGGGRSNSNIGETIAQLRSEQAQKNRDAEFHRELERIRKMGEPPEKVKVKKQSKSARDKRSKNKASRKSRRVNRQK